MKLQKTIIDEFKRLYANPTLKEIEDLTGIQKNRFFRIAHGMSMRLEEYLKLQELISEKKKSAGSIEYLFEQALVELTESQKISLENYLEREIQKAIFINSIQDEVNEEAYSA